VTAIRRREIVVVLLHASSDGPSSPFEYALCFYLITLAIETVVFGLEPRKKPFFVTR